jgi:hypothetical protein
MPGAATTTFSAEHCALATPDCQVPGLARAPGRGLRVSEATGADIEALGVARGHHTLVITRSARAARSSRSRWHHAPPGLSAWPSASAATDLSSWPRTVGGWTGIAPRASSAGLPTAPGSPSPSGRICCGTRSSPLPSTPEVPASAVVSDGGAGIGTPAVRRIATSKLNGTHPVCPHPVLMWDVLCLGEAEDLSPARCGLR